MRLASRAAPWFLLLSIGCSKDEGAARSRTDTPAEESLTAITAEQLKTRLRALHAKAVLVNAWATWCDSCEHELPMLQKLAEKLGPQDVRVVLVSVDEPEERDQVRKFLVEKSIQLPNYLAARPLGSFKAGINPRWPGMLPASFLFDGTGKLRYFWGGEAFESEIMPIVEGLLAGRPIDGESRFDVAPEGTNPRANATKK